ncbi:outer membrane protein/adhesin transport system outer membrane protein [Azospirillum lipoferum]|uniref:TolC family outer membrane protein n=1 Tax=Azospirillum lipoferum TaxID=193 RepID=A0A5A9GM68_AZOLI|nr:MULTISPECIES: TolC family outer membrane protein [Azospirillum]KAA0595550.1 TolC family outer membrane protein [Azospirillum lipoferum]MCP1611608.1 outer membrane protein/adhesin transport system outer membrane protein [Azospirillum lipoferum]MDW5537408.1 TolC family outer membrane protein [Azospirillum sp. NL1]
MNAESWRVSGIALAAGTMLAGIMLFVAPAGAMTLQEALSRAEATNPTLAAEQARLRAVDEQIPQAMSGYRPTVTATLGISRDLTNTRYQAGGGDRTETNAKSASISASQPLYDATVAPAVRRAERLVEAERATLLATEQTVLLNAATAYLDVVKNQELVALNTANEKLLQRQLKAAQDRARVGEYTRTDVAQADSRLAQAVASRLAAEGTLANARATFERLVGTAPGTLASPKPSFRLPRTIEQAASLARANNPSVLSAAYSEDAQRHRIDQQFGQLLPSASLSASGSRTWDPGQDDGVNYTRSDSLTAKVQVVAPLYQAGLPDSQVREAKQTAQQYRLQTQDQGNQSVESAVTAWAALETARANVQSYRDQIRAAQTALEGLREEAKVGSRTLLDVLDQEQELLNSRVNLVTAQRDETVAAFQLLSACGQLSPEQLGLTKEKR